jgi:hypothetical protein
MDEENDNFDLDAGVDEIASGMGWTSDDGQSDDFDDGDEFEDGGELPGKQTDEQEKAEGEKAPKNVAPEVTTKAPPASWAKEQHEHWAKMTPEQQSYVELREKQMLDGIEQYKQGHQFASDLMRTIEPFRAEIQSHGLTETQAINNLMNSHRVLTQGPLEARQQAFVELGRSIGLIPNEGQPQLDPQTQELQQRIARMEQQEQLRQQQIYQQEHSKVMSELDKFVADPEHAYFEEVAEDMLPFIKPGMSMEELKTVYDKAVWANPVTRAKEQSKLVAEQSKALAEKQKQEALAAQKARSTNVRRASTNRTSSEPLGSWDSTMQEVLAKRKNS